MNLLLVEDNPAATASFQVHLAEFGYSCEVAPSVHVAIDRLKQPGIDAIILDLENSVGIGPLEKMVDIGSDLPLVVITCSQPNPLKIASVSKGANKYIKRADAFNSVLLRDAIDAAIKNNLLITSIDEGIKKGQVELQAIQSSLEGAAARSK